MQALLDRKLVVITGKGGVGKTTVAAALAVLAARSGKRTLVVEVGQQSRVAELFGLPGPPDGEELALASSLSAISIDPDRALLEWLQSLGGRVSGRILASSGTFQYFAAAAPGAREIVTMVKLWRLTGGRRGRAAHDLVILDAPATGHALGMLRSPRTFGAIARVGPVARQTGEVHELLADERRSGYLAVALGTEMAVTETIELQDGLHAAVGRDLSAVVVNSLLPRRFEGGELDQVKALMEPGGARANGGARAALLGAAVRAAREVHDRAAFQHGQVGRLRRRGFEVIGLPFLWTSEVDLEAVEQLATRLERALR
jgi:anion-transporting  ArsA/GET3 family ATPase